VAKSSEPRSNRNRSKNATKPKRQKALNQERFFI
jgi:hypothetical protein